MSKGKKVEIKDGPRCAECNREAFKITMLGESVLCGLCARSYGDYDCPFCDGDGFSWENQKWEPCPVCDGDGTVGNKEKNFYSRSMEKGEKNDSGGAVQKESTDSQNPRTTGPVEDFHYVC